jgi:group I intron endonuclease
MLKVSGVYIIKNTINNKCYIGSSNNIYKRNYLHKSKLKRNKHHSIKLQNAYNKYGESVFIIEVLLKCPIEYLKKAEQKCINIFKPEYNMTNIVAYVPNKPIFRGKQNTEWIDKKKESYYNTMESKMQKTHKRNLEIVDKLKNGYSYEKIAEEYNISTCSVSAIKMKNNVIRVKNLNSGEKNKSSKLSEKDVINIRILRKEGKTVKELSKIFGVTSKNIESIVYNKSWKHLNNKKNEL